MTKTYKVCAAAAVSGAVLATAGPAMAANVDCSSSTAVPNPVYIAGSSAAQPILQSLATVLAAQTPAISILYAGPSSCLGPADMVNNQTESTTAWKFLDPVSGTALTCTAGANAYPPAYPDIGIADVYAASCVQPAVTLTSAFKEFHGAIQAMEIAVPWASSENSISQDAAYTVFGFGAVQYQVAPWTQPSDIFIRNPSSGTQVMTANAIGLLATKWLAGESPDAASVQENQTTTGLVTNLLAAAATAPNAAIGIIGAGNLDPLRGAPVTTDGGTTTGGLKPLAFQAKGEDCGYYPDSSLSTFDKINVRQGRYAIWGPVHLLTNVDSSGNVLGSPSAAQNLIPSTTANVATVVALITHQGLTRNDPKLQAMIDAETSAHFVPDCAMEVARTSEVSLGTSGGEMSYAPTGACGCYFESKTGGTISPYCQKCSADADCADAGVYKLCNYGYCEAQ